MVDLDDETLLEELMPEAEYGAIPFDLYALAHWDYERPRESDRDQWNTLVALYLALGPNERQTYHDQADRVRYSEDNWSPALLTPDNIDRVLRPFQDVVARNVSVAADTEAPPWVRSCYYASLEEDYSELESDAEAGDPTTVYEFMVLNDPDIYTAADDAESIRKMLTERLPGMFDHPAMKDNEATVDAAPQDLASLSSRMAMYVFVADKEAIENKHVKIMWFDVHGQCLLVSTMDPDDAQGLRGLFSVGTTMEEIVLEKCHGAPNDEE